MRILKTPTRALFRQAALLLSVIWLPAQTASLNYLNGNQPVVDAHNCYPYEGRWADRVPRALALGYPVGIEQDLAWFAAPHGSKGRVVVSHKAETTGAEPDEQQYFFERVRPFIENQLRSGDKSTWPLIVLHFDFKEVRPELLHAVWDMLGQYQEWITTAVKTADPHQLSSFDPKPILVLTEDSDAQEEVFFNQVKVGDRLRLFGSAHTNQPKNVSRQELSHLAATLPPEQLLTEHATNYRRWWNNSWYEVEEGGQPRAGAWSAAKAARLRSLVERAHAMGLWIRFYTLDGFVPATGEQQGWFAGYNFGSKTAVEERWQAAIAAGVNLIASDQYEDLAAALRRDRSR